jgi:hypothetical protein
MSCGCAVFILGTLTRSRGAVIVPAWLVRASPRGTGTGRLPGQARRYQARHVRPRGAPA